MKKIKLLSLKPYLIVFSCLCIFLLLSSFKLGIFSAQTFNNKKRIDFPVISLVPNLDVVEVKIKQTRALLSLRNGSNKVITAISLSSSGVNYRSEMIDTQDTVAPYALFIEQCGLPSPTSPEKGIKILAVVYEDGTSAGEPEAIKQIFDVRAGTQAQIERILPLFRDELSTPKAMRLMQKQEIVWRKLEQLPEEEIGRSFEFRLGLHDEKERAIDELRQLEQIEQEKGEDFARQALPHIVERYEKRNLSILNHLRQAQ